MLQIVLQGNVPDNPNPLYTKMYMFSQKGKMLKLKQIPSSLSISANKAKLGQVIPLSKIMQCAVYSWPNAIMFTEFLVQ